MQPQTKNFTLYRGDTHLFKVRLTAESTPLDLSQTHFQMDIVAGDGSVVRPEIKVADNLVVLLFPAALTRSLTWLRASYDLRAVCGNVVKTYLQGEIQVKPSVTNVVVDLSDDEPVAETVNVDVSGQAIIVLPSAGSTTDSAVIDGLLAKIQQLEVAVKEADESSEIAALSEQLAVAQAAIKSAGSLEGRLKLLESSSANISEQAVELAKQKAELDKALNKLVESDATVSALKSQLEILRIQFDSAKGSDEIEALHLKISKVMADLEVAKQSAAAAEESEELAALQKKIEDLQALSATQNSITSEIAELRRLLGLRKCEKIHLTQDLWSDGGYTWLEAKFKNTYNDPKVYLALEHKTMVVLFLNHNFGVKTGRSVRIRTNYDKPKIDVDYSVFLYVEEWSDSIS